MVCAIKYLYKVDKCRLCTFFAFSFLVITCAAQPSILWQKALGGSKDEEALDIQPTSDGGYIVVGSSKSSDGDVSSNHGGTDIWVLKLGQDGSIQWQNSFGGSANELARLVLQTEDGGYLVAGQTSSSDGDVTGFHGVQDIWLLKLSSDGALQWQRTLGGSEWDSVYGIQQTEGKKKGFIISGTTQSNDGDVTKNQGNGDVWMIKVNSSGVLEWQKTFGGTSSDAGGQILQTTEGGYMLACESNSNNGDFPLHYGNSDIWLFKLDTAGEVQWKKIYGGSDTDGIGSLGQTSDGGYILAMTTDSKDGDITGNHGSSDFWIAKLDSIGEIQWGKTFGGALDERNRSIQQTADGGFIVGGYARSYNLPGQHGSNTYDLWAFKLSHSGTLEWQKLLGGSSHETGGIVRASNDGSYIVAGTCLSNNGDVSGNHGVNDAWVLKLGGSVGVQYAPSLLSQLDVCPNPANGSIALKITGDESWMSARILDMQGRVVSEQSLQNGGILDVSLLPKGYYFASATTLSGKSFIAGFIKK